MALIANCRSLPGTAQHIDKIHRFFCTSRSTMLLVNRFSYPLHSKATDTSLNAENSTSIENSKRSTKDFTNTTRFIPQGIPKEALYLGFGGALPFVSLAFASGVVCPTQVANYIGLAQVGYGACILTFLGGVHWGKELILHAESPNSKTLIWSVLPSLYAWSAFCMPYHLALYYLATGLVGVAVYDLNDKTLPKWYRRLRVPLSLLASTSLAVTGFNLHNLVLV